MEYLIRRPRDRPRKPDGRCRKHPRHRQPPGVCSLCLREKLSQLSRCGNTSSSSNYRGTDGVDDSSCSSSPSSSSMSPYDESSSSGSSLASPVHHRYMSEKSRSWFFGWNKNVDLTKSRSIAFIPSGKGKEGGTESKGRGASFWSKLIPRQAAKEERRDRERASNTRRR